MGNWLLSGEEVKYKDWVLKQEDEPRRDSRGQWLIPVTAHPGHPFTLSVLSTGVVVHSLLEGLMSM